MGISSVARHISQCCKAHKGIARRDISAAYLSRRPSSGPSPAKGGEPYPQRHTLCDVRLTTRACLVRRPSPGPSLRREGNNHPRRERGNPKNVSHDVHPTAGRKTSPHGNHPCPRMYPTTCIRLQGPCLVPALNNVRPLIEPSTIWRMPIMHYALCIKKEVWVISLGLAQGTAPANGHGSRASSR